MKTRLHAAELSLLRDEFANADLALDQLFRDVSKRSSSAVLAVLRSDLTRDFSNRVLAMVREFRHPEGLRLIRRALSWGLSLSPQLVAASDLWSKEEYRRLARVVAIHGDDPAGLFAHLSAEDTLQELPWPLRAVGSFAAKPSICRP